MTRGKGRRDPRRLTRETALQLLYQWEIGHASLDEALATFWMTQADSVEDDARRAVETLARGVVTHLAELDPLLAGAAAHWRLDRMAVIDRLVLRIAAYELCFTPHVPAGVVINEALELARRFSTEEAVKFVNGVLDAIRRKIEQEGRAAPPQEEAGADAADTAAGGADDP